LCFADGQKPPGPAGSYCPKKCATFMSTPLLSAAGPLAKDGLRSGNS
jgi:hypothetical protein